MEDYVREGLTVYIHSSMVCETLWLMTTREDVISEMISGCKRFILKLELTMHHMYTLNMVCNHYLREHSNVHVCMQQIANYNNYHDSLINRPRIYNRMYVHV